MVEESFSFSIRLVVNQFQKHINLLQGVKERNVHGTHTCLYYHILLANKRQSLKYIAISSATGHGLQSRNSNISNITISSRTLYAVIKGCTCALNGCKVEGERQARSKRLKSVAKDVNY